jgi:serine/threonine protein kinase
VQAEELIGRTIANYTIQAIIGRGSMTVVYRTVDGRTGQMVALKVLFPLPGAEAAQERFRREAQLVRILDHPGIVPILALGDAAGLLFLTMPFIEGGSLANRLRLTGKLDETSAVDLAWQVADALHYAHTRGIVHRDIKPSNILLTGDGRAMLTDFGVARALDDPKLTQTGLTVGTPYYMAPEQAAGRRQVDGRADLYALGVVLFQLVTGRIPFEGSTPQVLHAHVYVPPPTPSDLANISPLTEAIILQALAKDPADRFQTGAEMAQALAQIEGGQAAQTQTQLEHLLTGSKRRLNWPVVVILVLVLVTAGGGWWFSNFISEPPITPTISAAQQALPASSTPSAPKAIDTPVTILTATRASPPTVSLTLTSPAISTPLITPTSTLTPNLTFTYPAGTLLKGSGEGVFRIGADGQLQHIFDWETFLAFGFVQEDIVPVEDHVLSQWPEFEELTRVVQDEAGVAYWVVDGERWAVERWQNALKSLNPSFADEVLLAQLPLTLEVSDLPAGTLLTIDAQTYYLLFDGGIVRRLDQDLLSTYGYVETDAVRIQDPILFNSNYQFGAALTPLIQPEGTNQVFLLEAGQRRTMPIGDALWALGYRVEDISIVPEYFVESFPLIVETPAITCDRSPAEFVNSFWQSNAHLAEKSGCPLRVVMTVVAWQPFEGGEMLWRQDLSLIYVLSDSGDWQVMGDKWRDGDLDFDPAIVAPNGRYQPVRGFGQVWREAEGVRETLGWGLSEEVGFEVQIQEFERGVAVDLATPGDSPKKVLLLFNDNTFQVFESTVD